MSEESQPVEQVDQNPALDPATIQLPETQLDTVNYDGAAHAKISGDIDADIAAFKNVGKLTEEAVEVEGAAFDNLTSDDIDRQLGTLQREVIADRALNEAAVSVATSPATEALDAGTEPLKVVAERLDRPAEATAEPVTTEMPAITAENYDPEAHLAEAQASVEAARSEVESNPAAQLDAPTEVVTPAITEAIPIPSPKLVKMNQVINVAAEAESETDLTKEATAITADAVKSVIAETEDRVEINPRALKELSDSVDAANGTTGTFDKQLKQAEPVPATLKPGDSITPGPEWGIVTSSIPNNPAERTDRIEAVQPAEAVKPVTKDLPLPTTTKPLSRNAMLDSDRIKLADAETAVLNIDPKAETGVLPASKDAVANPQAVTGMMPVKPQGVLARARNWLSNRTGRRAAPART